MARETLCKEVAESVRQDIIKGVWKPGDRLPGEYELAEHYDVSRFTIREAMKVLHSNGVIDIRRGVGMFVNQNKPESYIKGLLSHMVLEHQDIEMVTEARLPIELQTVALCARKADAQVVARLWEIYDEMSSLLDQMQVEEYNRLDLDFHLYIAEMAGNPILYEMLCAIQEFLVVQIQATLIPEYEKVSLTQHKRIIQAIEANDVELARLMMQRHIEKLNFAEGVEKELKKLL